MPDACATAGLSFSPQRARETLKLQYLSTHIFTIYIYDFLSTISPFYRWNNCGHKGKQGVVNMRIKCDAMMAAVSKRR